MLALNLGFFARTFASTAVPFAWPSPLVNAVRRSMSFPPLSYIWSTISIAYVRRTLFIPVLLILATMDSRDWCCSPSGTMVSPCAGQFVPAYAMVFPVASLMYGPEVTKGVKGQASAAPAVGVGLRRPRRECTATRRSSAHRPRSAIAKTTTSSLPLVMGGRRLEREKMCATGSASAAPSRSFPRKAAIFKGTGQALGLAWSSARDRLHGASYSAIYWAKKLCPLSTLLVLSYHANILCFTRN